MGKFKTGLWGNILFYGGVFVVFVGLALGFVASLFGGNALCFSPALLGVIMMLLAFTNPVIRERFKREEKERTERDKRRREIQDEEYEREKARIRAREEDRRARYS